MTRQLDLQSYTGTLAGGGQVSLNVLEYFALTAGSGLQVAAKGRGRFVGIDLYNIIGDGSSPLGTIVLNNPTGGSITYTVLTSSVAFNPTALSNTSSVTITSSVPLSSSVVGLAGNGSAVSGFPVRVAGSDGTLTRDIATTTGGLVRTVSEATASGGASRSRLRAAASTNATSVKASAGKVYGWQLSNPSAAVKFFKLYDKASAPTVGTDTPIAVVLVPAGQSVAFALDTGIACTLGIAFATTALEPDADTTALAAGDLHITVLYL